MTRGHAAAAAVAALLVAVLALAVLQLTKDDGPGPRPQRSVSRAEALAEALARLRADAPGVAVVESDLSTGPGAAAKRLALRFPGIGLGLEQELGIPLGDLEAIAGEPVAVDLEQRIAAVVVPGDPERAAATLKANGRAAEVRGRVVITATRAHAAAVAAAARRPAGEGLTTRALDDRLRGVDRRGAVAVATTQGTVPFARRTAVALVPERDRVAVRARIDVPDPPLARGPQPPAPRPPRTAPLTIAVRDGATALKRLRQLLPNPQLDELDATLKRFAGLDLQREVLDRLTGTTTITSRDGRTFSARGDLNDAPAVADALDGLNRAGRLGRLAGLLGIDTGGYAVGDGPDGTKTITKDDRLLVRVGVVDGALVATNDPAAKPRAIAAARPLGRLLPARGALRAHVAEDLLTGQLIARLGLPRFAAIVLAPLGDLTATAQADDDGISVLARVGVREDGG